MPSIFTEVEENWYKCFLIVCFFYELNTTPTWYNLFFLLLNSAVELLDGIANTGMVELGDAQLATYLAEKKPSGQPFFRYGKGPISIILHFPF